MAKRVKRGKPGRAKPGRTKAGRPRTAIGAKHKPVARAAVPAALLAPQRNGIASTRATIGLLDDADVLVLARLCRDAAQGKKAEDVVMLDIRKLANFADYFVLATGRSLIQARAVADAVVEACEDRFGSPIRTEGYADGGWILVDYGPVIVHVFLPQTREFYNLERLWGKPASAAKRAAS
ncbi:MAG TPA: ribosome silencing factor [Candidatus Eremiobacteraceae bacterium]|nr:ribosome silencing factor [Candidatus Eremiobacteraceae bacterium]